jgi:endonuclease YncB( thermonuclease family)
MGACSSSNSVLSIHNASHNKYLDNQINWAAVEYKDTVQFHPEITVAKCIKVYDGDTITIACGLPPYQPGNPVYRWSVRLRDIDSPEMRTKCASVLANVFVGGVNVTDALLAENLAVPYGGGTKQTPDDWLEFHRKACSE